MGITLLCSMGVMELLPADYAEILHQSRLHPYSQHLEFADGKWYWVVSCLNEQAVNVIILYFRYCTVIIPDMAHPPSVPEHELMA